MGKFNQWFTTFLDEKELPVASWEIVDSTGNTNFIDSEIVIEHIKIASENEQSQIKDILVQIDFKNGDINHFLKHLATGLITQY